MKKLLLPLLFVLGTVAVSYAQDYDSAVGLRLGYPTSITYKKFISESNALEVYGGFRGYGTYSSFRVAGAYLIHDDLGDTEGLKFYYGAGVGAEFYSYRQSYLEDRAGVGIIVSGYIGLEYTLEEVPLTISLDYAPSIVIGGRRGFRGDGITLAARYILNR